MTELSAASMAAIKALLDDQQGTFTKKVEHTISEGNKDLRDELHRVGKAMDSLQERIGAMETKHVEDMAKLKAGLQDEFLAKLQEVTAKVDELKVAPQDPEGQRPLAPCGPSCPEQPALGLRRD